MAENMIYDYYYGDESSQFSFYRIPRQLITGQHFKKVSTDAKLLYGLLLDRMAYLPGMAGMMTLAVSIFFTRWMRFRRT